MNIEGNWYMQPGDIPAGFVFPLYLHADGRAEWIGERSMIEPYHVTNGKLVIGDRQCRIIFELRDDPAVLLGTMLTESESDEDMIDEDDGALAIIQDAAMLLRDSRGLPFSTYAAGPAERPDGQLALDL